MPLRPLIISLLLASISGAFTGIAQAAVPSLVAAGDIACAPESEYFNGGLGDDEHCRQQATSDLFIPSRDRAIIPLGDTQYEIGDSSAYQRSFDLSWGRAIGRMFPVIGNHEYGVRGAHGYFDYFNGVGKSTGRAGHRSRGYYRKRVGGWQVYILNSTCGAVGGCGVGSPQYRWLRRALAGNPSRCAVAAAHHARFSSGSHGNSDEMAPLWRLLDRHGVDVMLQGHDHHYERFAPLRADGTRNNNGIRSFVVGTGGKSLRKHPRTRVDGSHFLRSDQFGVLRLHLGKTRYRWGFQNIDRQILDTGSARCRS